MQTKTQEQIGISNQNSYQNIWREIASASLYKQFVSGLTLANITKSNPEENMVDMYREYVKTEINKWSHFDANSQTLT